MSLNESVITNVARKTIRPTTIHMTDLISALHCWPCYTFALLTHINSAAFTFRYPHLLLPPFGHGDEKEATLQSLSALVLHQGCLYSAFGRLLGRSRKKFCHSCPRLDATSLYWNDDGFHSLWWAQSSLLLCRVDAAEKYEGDNNTRRPRRNRHGRRN